MRPSPSLLATAVVLPLTGILFASGLALHRGAQDGTGFGSLPNASIRRLAALPPVILWAWERPEDLRLLPPRRVGVSFLAETVRLIGGEVRVRPRLQVFKVLPATPLVACARIEADAKLPPALTADQVSVAASAVAQLANLAGVAAVQVDFDATKSERVFYADLLRALRRMLPPAMPLSITALTSWCTGDPWIVGLPVDEAVPMLFRMGPDAEEIKLSLAEGRDFSLAVCRESVGISTDEAIPNLPSGRRRYMFRPEGWSPDAVRGLAAREDQP